MSRSDPMQPFYERERLMDTDEVATVIREILRFIKQINPNHMMTWNTEDTNDAIQLAKEQNYTVPMLSMAYNRLRKQAEKQKIDFNSFYQIIADIKAHWEDYNPKYNSYNNEMDWREKDRALNKQHMERVVVAPKSGSSAIKAYWVKHIRADLKKVGVKDSSFLSKIVDHLT